MTDITVRRLRFELPDELDPVFIEGEPEESYQSVAISLLLPYLEPYLIRTMKAARPEVRDPDLVADLDQFIGQEGQHYRQHRSFNDLFRRHFAGLERFEEEIEADYQRFSREKSLRFNLAYAEGFEALTTALACVGAEQDKSRWNAAVLDLFQWHLLEELEHRTVAFDVYGHVVGSYPHRVAVGLFAQWHLIRFVARTSKHMMEHDPDLVARYGGRPAQRKRERRILRIALYDLLPRAIRTHLPWYTPRKLVMPAEMPELAAAYTQRAERIG